jgi:hypothetical protein
MVLIRLVVEGFYPLRAAAKVAIETLDLPPFVAIGSSVQGCITHIER